MARPRSFSESDVLDAAVACFWRRGLEATTVRDLAAEMGLNAPSLYNAFGDKRQLFARALQHYAGTAMRERVVRLEQQGDGRRAITLFFEELITRSLADREHKGCLIVNSALEVAPHDPELRAVILDYLDEIEGFFARRLHSARAAGLIGDHIEPAATARMLLALVVGLRVAARITPERQRLEDMVRPALALLGISGTASATPASP